MQMINKMFHIHIALDSLTLIFPTFLKALINFCCHREKFKTRAKENPHLTYADFTGVTVKLFIREAIYHHA